MTYGFCWLGLIMKRVAPRRHAKPVDLRIGWRFLCIAGVHLHSAAQNYGLKDLIPAVSMVPDQALQDLVSAAARTLLRCRRFGR